MPDLYSHLGMTPFSQMPKEAQERMLKVTKRLGRKKKKKPILDKKALKNQRKQVRRTERRKARIEKRKNKIVKREAARVAANENLEKKLGSRYQQILANAPSAEEQAQHQIYINDFGYLAFIKNGKPVHREVCKTAHGVYPKDWHVHHIDGNRYNNAPENLIALPAYLHEQSHMKNPLPSRTELVSMLNAWSDELEEKQRIFKEIEDQYLRIKFRIKTLTAKEFTSRNTKK